jgi:zinc protease
MKTRSSWRAAVAALGLFIVALVPLAPAHSKTLPAGVKEVATVEGVTEYRLDNGLQVLLYPDPSKPTVTVNVTYKVGSRHENYGETGMAHLLEHLIFKGSKNHPNPDKEFARRGFRNNGTTSFDRTNYFSTFQATDDNLRWALEWKADAMVNSFIAKKDLDSEMTVVRNEFEMGENSPFRVTYQRMLGTAFQWHNYGKTPIGNRSDIENVRIENLQAFYRMYYQPDNAVLTVAGKFDVDQTLKIIAETFGQIPRPTRALPPLWTVEPTQDGERSFVVRRKGDVQLVLVGYRIPSLLSDSAAAIGAAADILGDTPNGRLHRELVQTGMASQVFGWTLQQRDPGLVIFGAVVKKGDPVEPVRNKLVEIIETSFAKQAPTEAEMTRMRQDNATSFERTLADPQQFGVALSEYIAAGDWRLYFLSRDQVDAVKADAVASAAARYFRRDNRTVGLFQPEDEPQRAEIPAPMPVAALLADFKPRQAVAAGEAFDPSQKNIDARTRRFAIGDLNVALLPKKNRGETVDVVIRPRWGDERSLYGKSVVAALTDAMVTRGTSKMTRQQIADEMTRLKMEGSPRGFRTDRANLAESLRLSAHVMRDASFPADEFAQLKRETITGLQSRLSDPEARSRDAIGRHFNTYPPGDPRAFIPMEERIKLVEATTLDDVKRFHAEFWGTGRGEIVIVGDFDDKQAEALIRDLFAGWNSKAPYALILSEPREIAAQRLAIDTPDKENAFYRARINLTLRDDDPDYAPLMLANYIFGGGSGLSNRLIDRVRQRDGVSYGAWSGLSVGSRDRAASWQIAGLVAPQNAAKFEQSVREEIDRMLKAGFTEKEIADAKNGMLQERLMGRSSDGTLASAWANYLDLGRTFTSYSLAFEDRIKSLTAAEVNDAVRRHIDPKKMTVVIAGDAAKGAK